jgi:hypothetical protein
MAKVRHRVFEIYESVDESILQLTSRSEKIALDLGDPGTWTFKYLTVQREAGVTLVRFTEPRIVGDELLAGLREDFVQLATHLSKDIRILLDFTGVESTSSELIAILALFARKLRVRGSRIVLCGLSPAVREVFFAVE